MNEEKLFIESELHRLLQLIKCDGIEKTGVKYEGPPIGRMQTAHESIRLFDEWINKMRGHKVSQHAKGIALSRSGRFVPIIDDTLP